MLTEINLWHNCIAGRLMSNSAIIKNQYTNCYCKLIHRNKYDRFNEYDVCFRIKFVVTQKVLIIKNLNKKLSDTNLRCEHLEKLLDQQRKEYILKTL